MLPVAARACASCCRPEGQRGGPGVSGSGARVLVVDDERAIQRALKATLRPPATTSTSSARVPTRRPGRAQAARPRAARPAAARTARATRSRARSAPGRTSRSCSCRRSATSARRSRRSTPAPTTTSPSRSASTSCWHACARCCAGLSTAAARRRRRARRAARRPGRKRVTRTRRGPPHADRVRPPAHARRAPGQGADAQGDHPGGMGAGYGECHLLRVYIAGCAARSSATRAPPS